MHLYSLFPFSFFQREGCPPLWAGGVSWLLSHFRRSFLITDFRSENQEPGRKIYHALVFSIPLLFFSKRGVPAALGGRGELAVEPFSKKFPLHKTRNRFPRLS